jgi:hypothetical protein
MVIVIKAREVTGRDSLLSHSQQTGWTHFVRSGPNTSIEGRAMI